MNAEKTARNYINHTYPAGVTTPEQKRAHRRATRKLLKSAEYEGVKTLQGNPPALQIQTKLPGIIALYRQPEPQPSVV